jgi:phosphate uptake regulator
MWKLLMDTGVLAKEMTEKTLDGVQSKNLPLLEDLTENYPGDFDRLVNLAVKDHAQPEVIRVMAEIIEEEDDEVIRIKNRSDLLVYLRILLDGFLKTGA